MSIRLVQLQSSAEPHARRLAFVEEPHLRLFENIHSTYDLLQLALRDRSRTLADLIEDALGDELVDYDPIYNNQSDWKILPPIDHPERARCVISGTGLTHLGSAKSRSSMHDTPAPAAAGSANKETPHETDSMKMFRWGVESGKPAHGTPGIAPEWFYKGNGTLLRAHNQPLDVPDYAEDGGEEAELVGIYLIDQDGTPLRLGICQGNEFSDHVFEKKNYLNLAGSKLRTSAIGPELVLHPPFKSIPGTARVLRGNAVLWEKPMATGEDEMSHSLANLEHHHFKFEVHRRPGDIHIHFYGTSALSFAAGLKLQNGDVMEVSFQNFGRPLRNPVRVATPSNTPVAVRELR